MDRREAIDLGLQHIAVHHGKEGPYPVEKGVEVALQLLRWREIWQGRYKRERELLALAHPMPKMSVCRLEALGYEVQIDEYAEALQTTAPHEL